MFELHDFFTYCENENIDVIPYMDAPYAGTTIRDGDCCAVFLDFNRLRSTRLLRGVCLHEMGHIASGAFHKISSPFELVERSEYRANLWAAEQHITEADFREAFSAGITELWELAEYFDLPEQDIKNALTYWSERRRVNFNE